MHYVDEFGSEKVGYNGDDFLSEKGYTMLMNLMVVNLFSQIYRRIQVMNKSVLQVD